MDASEVAQAALRDPSGYDLPTDYYELLELVEELSGVDGDLRAKFEVVSRIIEDGRNIDLAKIFIDDLDVDPDDAPHDSPHVERVFWAVENSHQQY